VVFNGALSEGALSTQGVAQPAVGTSLASTMGTRQVQKVSLDTTTKTLSVTPQLATPSSSMSWDSDSPIATFGKPDSTSVDLSAGALSESEPITLPAGPGGLTPQVNLTYSSAAVNGQHNPSAAAGWVGEGWSLSTGEISWSESNVLAGCSNSCSAEWENMWNLSDPYGTSSQLVPPNINVSTYYDDTPNYYCATGNPAAYPCPILWHTATESHDKIYAYVGPVNIGQPVNPPCWRVWLPNGLMEEFGCTSDSLQYYYEAGLGAIVTGWYLDMVTDPQGNQIHFTYQSDMENWTSVTTGKTYSYPRDVELSTIQYDSPVCHSVQSMCTGSSWAPQMQVVFNASHGVAQLTGSLPSGCNTGANMRCDDPVDLSGNNGYATSLIQNTYVLNGIQVQVRTSGTGSWNTLRSYTLSYEQSGPATSPDPASGIQRSTAGMLDLTQIQQYGSPAASSMLYSGEDNNSSTSFAYLKAFDVSSKDLVVGPNTTLSYWIYPQSNVTSGLVSGSNSTCVALDMVFSDGTDLRDSGAVDQNGNQLHPAHQCGHLTLDQWNYVTSDIGAAVNGKTINRIDVGYDQPANTGGYRGYIDDISLTNPTSSTPLFATDFESGSPQLTWTNSVDNTGGGNIANVGGICCGLTGPELWSGGQAVAHTDSATLPPITFSYTNETNTYVDSFFHPNSAAGCGPAWNTGNGSGCLLWSQSYAGNDRFLSSSSNGQGLSQSFIWAIAHNNSHGVPGGGANNANPFACDNNQSGYPCNEADDSGWSQAVLTQQNNMTIRLTQNGQVGAQSSTQNFHGANDGNWYGNVQSLTVTVNLHAGNNTILFSNPSAPAPNIDRITVAGTSYEAEAPGNTLGGGARVDACSTCSGGKEVDWIGNPSNTGALQFNGINASTAGTYPLTIYYIDADAGRSAQVTVNGTSTPVMETTNYSYQLTYPLTAQECSDCVAGMYWGNQNDNDYLNFYNAVFMGFAQATVDLPTGAVQIHKYYAGEGWGVYDTGQVKCYTAAPCHNDAWWDLANAAHGAEYQTLSYDTDGSTLLQQVNTTYTATCPPSGVGGTPASSTYGNWDGKLVSSLDHNNPVAACDIQQNQQTTQTFDGSSNPVSTTTNDTYDIYGRITQEATTSNGGTPTKVVKNIAYVWNDTVTATQTSASGTYIIKNIAFTDTEDGSGNRLACSYTSYDGQSYLTGPTSALTGGLATTKTSYSNCGTSSNSYAPSGPSTVTLTYNAYGNAVGNDDADANAGISGHTGCTINSAQYTNCTAYDGTFDVFQTSLSNALNQTTSTSYANTGGLFGYGTWPLSRTTANNQTTSYTYDALGRMTSQTEPRETSGVATKQWIYTNWCSGTAAQSPCDEIDEVDRLDSSTTTTTRAFYDGEGRLIETRAPGSNGQDVVTFIYYDTSGRQVFKSNPYFVTAYTGVAGAAAYSIPDSTQPGTSTNYSNLRQTSVTDPNSYTTTTTESVICGVSGTSDTGCYKQSMVVDANGHQSATLTGGLGKTNYTQKYNGTNSSGYTLYATTAYTYDATDNLLSTVSPDSSTTTSVYDALGQVTSQADPDNGTTTYTYDANGNLTESVDARGSAGTVYNGYDGLNRIVWSNSSNSPSGALVTYTYDSTANGNNGVWELTGESFTGSGGLSGSYAYSYDARGQQTGETLTVNGTSYPTQTTYNDNGQISSQTYPTGEVVTPGYSSTGWLTGLSTQSGSMVTTLASNLAYTGLAGATGEITTMDFGSGDIYNASYDTGMRLTSASLNRASNNALLYSTQPAYDSANNVVSVQTNISGATDTQQFCYDSLNRMTWAGSTGTPPCASLTPGTLTAAQYQQSDAYNVEGQLTSGPAGSYTYGDSSHPHAVTSTSSGYSAAYDAAGNMTCRAPSNASTCSGTQTGQQLSYDAEGRLTSWQNQPNSPSSTANYLYDGAGNRVAMSTTVNGTTTTTAYIGSIEEVQTTGGSTTTTTYYAIGNQRIAAAINGTFDYFGYDALGSQVVVLNNSGNIIGSQLYGPYGDPRYSTGTLPTSIGFTGQQADSVTGLDYYVARYYDPVVGGFLSPDSVQGNAQGMNPYAYVGNNPETWTDPTGQMFVNPGRGGGSGITTTPRRNSQDTTHRPAPGKQPSACAFVCGSFDWGTFWIGLGKLILGLVVGLGLMGAFIASVDSSGGLMGILWNYSPAGDYLKSAITAAFRLALQGIQTILHAFQHVNPWVDVVFDAVGLLIDVVYILLNFSDTAKAISRMGWKSATFWTKVWNAIKTIWNMVRMKAVNSFKNYVGFAVGMLENLGLGGLVMLLGGNVLQDWDSFWRDLCRARGGKKC